MALVVSVPVPVPVYAPTYELGCMAANAADQNPKAPAVQLDKVEAELKHSPLPVAFFCDKHGRETNQDALAADFSSPTPVYVMIDGHGGTRTAAYTAVTLAPTIAAHLNRLRGLTSLKSETPCGPALVSAFNEVRNDFKDFSHERVRHIEAKVDTSVGSSAKSKLSAKRNWQYDGACVLAATVANGCVSVAWAGDCEAVVVGTDVSARKNRLLSKDSKYGGTVLAVSHLADTTEAKDELAARGKRLGLKKPPDGWVVEERVQGILDVSRAFGDMILGDIIWEPDVAVAQYKFSEGDKFLVLMSDGVAGSLKWEQEGLWPVKHGMSLGNTKLCALQRHADRIAEIIGPHDSAQAACHALFKAVCKHEAETKSWAGPHDNVCALVIDIRSAVIRRTTSEPQTASVSTQEAQMAPISVAETCSCTVM